MIIIALEGNRQFFFTDWENSASQPLPIEKIRIYSSVSI